MRGPRAMRGLRLRERMSSSPRAAHRSARLCRLSMPNALQRLPGPVALACSQGSDPSTGSAARMSTAFASPPGPHTALSMLWMP
jgi:hypothetical protein